MKQQSLKIFSKEETGPYELPKGWQWVKLGEVLKEDRKTINPQDYPAENFWLVTMDCVESNTGKLLKKINLCGKEIKSTKYQFNFNHVLYGKLRPYLNKVYAVPEGERGICTTEFIPFIPLNADKKYIAFYLRKKEVIEFAMNNLTGTRQPRVNIEALLSFQIPLPSLPEQKRIVARIEALFSKIDEIKRLRKEANDLAKTLMPSALHEVFSKADEKGWKWVRLGEVVSHIQSGFACSKKYETKNGIPHLRPNNIGFNGELDLSKLVHIPAEIVDLTKYSLKKGDVLFNNTNSKELVGRAALITQDLDYGFSNHITRLRVNKELITPLWMVLTVNYLWLQGYFLKICQKWIGHAGVNTKMLKSIQIPLPPLPEQKRIVAYLDNIQQKAQALQRLQEETEKEVEKVREAILHKAFQGEL